MRARPVRSRLACLPNALTIGLFCLALAQLSPARAAPTDKRTLIVRAQGCPGAELVRELLSPLVSHERDVHTESAAASADVETVEVRDLGDDYVIVLPGARRAYYDPQRDCQERARVAAVFIALNLGGPDNTESEPSTNEAARVAAPSAQREPESPTPATPLTVAARDERLHLDLGAFASVAFTPSEQGAVPGGGLDLSLRLGIWQVGVRALLAPESKLAISGEGGGHVALLRIPGVLFAGALWRIPRIELGPVLGVALDGLRVRGRDLLRNERSWRANLGGYVGVQAQLLLKGWLALTVLAASSLYPRSYELRVEPDPRRARTPHVWFSAQLGLACRLR